MLRSIALILVFCAAGNLAADPEAAASKTIIGPSNPDLYDGAQLILSGDVEAGVRLTLRGMPVARNARELNVALANLCGGYALLDKLDEALEYCDRAIARNDKNWRAYNNRALVNAKLGEFAAAEQDLESAFALRPNAKILERSRQFLLAARDPVTPKITIDDRPLDERF